MCACENGEPDICDNFKNPTFSLNILLTPCHLSIDPVTPSSSMPSSACHTPISPSSQHHCAKYRSLLLCNIGLHVCLILPDYELLKGKDHPSKQQTSVELTPDFGRKQFNWTDSHYNKWLFCLYFRDIFIFQKRFMQYINI